MDISAIVDGIKEKANNVAALGSTLKLDLGEKKVFIDGTGEANAVEEADKEADCTVSITPENFMALVKGELNPMMAMMTGKVKIKGDMGVAMKLQSLLG